MFCCVTYPKDTEYLNVIKAQFTHWYGKSDSAWINENECRLIVRDSVDNIKGHIMGLEKTVEGLSVGPIDVSDENLSAEEREWMTNLRQKLSEIRAFAAQMSKGDPAP